MRYHGAGVSTRWVNFQSLHNFDSGCVYIYISRSTLPHVTSRPLRYDNVSKLFVQNIWTMTYNRRHNVAPCQSLNQPKGFWVYSMHIQAVKQRGTTCVASYVQRRPSNGRFAWRIELILIEKWVLRVRCVCLGRLKVTEQLLWKRTYSF